MPLSKLVHVTHNVEACKIRKEEGFVFEPRQKFGKVLGAYDGRPCGESFKFDGHSFVQICDDETVFPGQYSWWGINPTDEINHTPVSDIYRVIYTLNHNDIDLHVPEYLQADPESRYGSQAFVCSFQNLLFSYAESRNVEFDKVCVRKGGTLRYTKEICYVLLICTDSDMELAQFQHLEIESPPFHSNGLINHNGTICNPHLFFSFYPKYTVSYCEELQNPEMNKAFLQKRSYSYETVAVGFYFPMPIMRVREVTPKSVRHDKICIKKKVPPQGGKAQCPDKIKQ